MGLNYQRDLGCCAIHSFGHRMESTMAEVYGSWSENRLLTNFDRYALDEAQSPNYNFSGCGNIHYPANATADYDYSDMRTALEICDDFIYYPTC